MQGKCLKSRVHQEWRAMLSDMEYHVMRKRGARFYLTLDKNYADGMYIVGDAICRFIHLNKYNWHWLAQLWQAQEVVATKEDRKFFMVAPNATAAAADHIWDMYSMTAPNQRANATASTASAWFLRPPKT